MELREKGNAFYNQKDFEIALRKYAKARRYLMHSYFITPSPADPIDDQYRSELLTKTELNMALAAFHVPRPAQCRNICRDILNREVRGNALVTPAMMDAWLERARVLACARALACAPALPGV